MSHADAAELLGAFALHAVDGPEREAVEEHVRACRACQAELAQHREVVAFLAPGWTQAPEGVWDRIAGSLEENPPAMERPPNVTPLRPRRSRPVRVTVGAAAAAVVAVFGFLSVKVVDLGQRLDRMEAAAPGTDLGRAISEARADPSTRRAELRSDGGGLVAEALIRDDGVAYVIPADLPPVGPDRTYQLWGVHGDDTVSLGLLGPTPVRSVFRTSDDVSALAITDEPAGGVVVTEQRPVAVGRVS